MLTPSCSEEASSVVSFLCHPPARSLGGLAPCSSLEGTSVMLWDPCIFLKMTCHKIFSLRKSRFGKEEMLSLSFQHLEQQFILCNLQFYSACLIFFFNLWTYHLSAYYKPVLMCLVSQSCLILWDPIDCSPPGSSVHGILQARILEWVSMLSSRGSFQPRDGTQVSHIAGWFFTVWATSENSKKPNNCQSSKRMSKEATMG